MNESSTSQSPQAAARKLGVSPGMLRRWSDEFAPYLSGGGDSTQGKTQRRYTQNDMATLTTIKELINNGMTYEQVRQQLADQKTSPAEATLPYGEADLSEAQYADISSNGNEETALMAANESESPAIAFLTNTLMALSDSQKSVLNSQAANRELMGVLIQDNFNLKEENNRLRERILEIERNTAEIERQAVQIRQEEEWRREMLRQEMEAKITSVQQMATEAFTTAHSIEMPDIKAIETNPGCLGALFGRGGTKILTVPRRHRGSQEELRPTPTPPAASSQIQPSFIQPSPPTHPKPTVPPE